MSASTTFRWFRSDRCQLCGLCLQNCPVLQLPEAAAVADKRQLLTEHPEKSLAFRFCTTCNVCDSVCPHQADPYELVLECFDRRGREKGLPYLARMVVPNEPENIWSGVRPLMSQSERRALDQWADNLQKPQQAVILTGFYTNLVPYLAETGVVQSLGLPIAGSEGLWGCGGDTHKLGNIGLTEAVVRLLETTLDTLGAENIYCFMQAEAAMLTEILPRYYGAKKPTGVSSLDELLREKIESQAIALPHQLDLTVTVHDNCMSRYMGGRPQETVRHILIATGCRLVEMEHHCSHALCCGWAATIPTLYAEKSGNPFKTLGYLLYSLHRRLAEAEATGADALVTGCPACYLFLNLIKTVTNSPLAVYHLVEVVEMASGGTLPRKKAEERSWDILAQSTTLILNWLVFPSCRQRFSPRPPSTTRIDPPAPQPRGQAFVTRMLAGIYKSPLVRNPVSRTGLALAVKVWVRGYGAWLNRRKRQLPR